MNSGRRDRRRFAALERTANLVDASVRLQIPLEKFSREDWIMALMAGRGVESMVAIWDSVAGSMIWILISEGGWWAPFTQLEWCSNILIALYCEACDLVFLACGLLMEVETAATVADNLSHGPRMGDRGES